MPGLAKELAATIDESLVRSEEQRFSMF